MIRVTIELVSAISPDRSKTLGVAEIWNERDTTLATNGSKGDYSFRLSKRSPKLKETWKSGRVENFSRKQRGAWDLLYLVLRSVLAKRNPDALRREQS